MIAAVRPAVDAECSFLLAGTGGQMKQAAQQQLAYSVFFFFEFPVFLAEPLSGASSLSDKTS